MVPFHDKVTIFLSGGNIYILRRREQMMLIQPNVMSQPIYYRSLFRNNSNKKYKYYVCQTRLSVTLIFVITHQLLVTRSQLGAGHNHNIANDTRNYIEIV